MDIKGKVLKVFPKKQISEKFAKREFVIATEDKYPQQIIIQTTQERCDLLNDISEGDEVQTFINIRGREWISPTGEQRYFNTLEAWKITNESAQSFGDPSATNGNIESNFKEDAINSMAPNNDLPF